MNIPTYAIHVLILLVVIWEIACTYFFLNWVLLHLILTDHEMTFLLWWKLEHCLKKCQQFSVMINAHTVLSNCHLQVDYMMIVLWIWIWLQIHISYFTTKDKMLRIFQKLICLQISVILNIYLRSWTGQVHTNMLCEILL